MPRRTSFGDLLAAGLILGLTRLGCAADFPKFENLKDSETRQQAKLSATEVKEIVDQVEATAGDTPESWEAELRFRRVRLGGVEGLLVRGSRLLCGATGNCTLWVFRKNSGRWVSLFTGSAPIADGFGFAPESSHGIPNLVISTNLSAAEAGYTVFTFDGRRYTASQCYRSVVRDGGGSPRTEAIACR